MKGLVWLRYGQWAAHLFEGDLQLCPTRHGYFRGGNPGPTPPPLKACEVGSHGLPYGRVCTRCLKAWHRRGAA